MLSRILLCLTAAAAACALPVDASAQSPEKPNIVFMISDDHRWDGLGVVNPKVQTPALDRMAKEGQWYRDFTIQSPTCSTSRAAILTGLPPYSNGWYSNEFQRKDVINANGFDRYNLLPEEMGKAGYHTALTGKWHLKPEPWNCGFQTISRWMVGGAGAFVDPRLATGRSREMNPVKGFTQNIFADDAIEQLNKRAAGETTQPLFLWVAFTAPHGPFGPNPEKFEKMYTGKTAEELAPATYYDDPEKAKAGRQNWNNYYASISALDEQVGRIMDTIRQSSLADNTVVVFMGDNGFMMGRRDMNGKYVPYEDSLRVPMIAWASPAYMSARGTTVTAAVNSLDLPPTFVKLAGGTPPPDWTGRDFSPVLGNGQTNGFDYSVSSYPDHDSLIAHAKAYRVIRSPEHKLILWHPDHSMPPELYDLQKDPAENTNLYENPEAADVRKKLTGLLDEYRARTGDDQWDMKGPLGMFEPERLKWMSVDEGPAKQTSAPAEAKTPADSQRPNPRQGQRRGQRQRNNNRPAPSQE